MNHCIKWGLASLSAAYWSFHSNGQSSNASPFKLASAEQSPLAVPFNRRLEKPNIGSRPCLDSLYFKMFQYVTCPFCCKLRAYLNYRGIPCDIVEVNSVRRQQLHWTKENSDNGKYGKVPQLIIALSNSMKDRSSGLVYLKDSSVIISVLESYLIRRNRNHSTFQEEDRIGTKQIEELNEIASYYPYVPSSKGYVATYENRYQIMYGETLTEQVEKRRRKEMRWREWVDSIFVHYISPNVYRTPSEALEAFHYFREVGEWDALFTTWEKWLVVYLGAIVMYFVAIRLRFKHRLKKDVRESLYDGAGEWLRAMGNSNFMGGSSPDLSDLAMFGVLTSFEGCRAFADLMDHCPALRSWYDRMDIACREHHGADVMKIRS